MDKISVILTSYKHENYISQAIESIINQNYKDWELLIWDDSPDLKTFSVIEKYLWDERIKAWHYDKNKWLVENLNFLISKISPDWKYIVFLEWDDWLDSNYIKKKMEIFKEDKDVGLIYNDLITVDENWNIIKKNFLKSLTLKKFTKWKMLRKKDFLCYWPYYMSWSSLMIKKDCLNKLYPIKSYWNKMFSVSDRDAFWKIACENKIYWMEDCLTYFRQSNNSLWHRSDFLKDQRTVINSRKEEWFINNREYQAWMDKLTMNEKFNTLWKNKLKNLKTLIYIYIKHPIMFTRNIIYKIIFLFSLRRD